MSKTVLHGNDARTAIVRGVDFLADVVKITEGPRGRNIILGQRALGQSPKVTRDGVTVSNYVDPPEPSWQMGADLIREAAQKTDNAVGDGTTASIVLAQAMIHAGFSLIQQGANPMAMERGIRKAAEAVVLQVRRMAVNTTDEKTFQVATVSAHGDSDIGKLVADAIRKAGSDGVVTAEPSTTSNTFVETVAGLELEKANLLSTVFITHPEEMKAELHDCRILLWEGVIATAKSLIPILKQVADSGTPLLIVAGGYEPEALAVLIKNKASLGAGLQINAVRMEYYGERRKEVMRDIAALTGGKAFTEDMGTKIETVKIAELGSARKTVTTMSKTQIIEGKGKQEELVGRVAMIRTAMETAAPLEKTLLRVRLAALTGGITIIKVGGTTVTEMEEKKDRVVDAMSAAKAAVESGIVPGGGTALFRAGSTLDGLRKTFPHEEITGIDVVRVACSAIVRQIATNAGVNGEEVAARLQLESEEIGYNAQTYDFENLVETGIIDPVKVVVASLQNATAVACSILTMGATVSEIMEKRNV